MESITLKAVLRIKKLKAENKRQKEIIRQLKELVKMLEEKK